MQLPENSLFGWAFGGTVFVAGVAAVWGYIKLFGRQALGRMIAKLETTSPAADALLFYCTRNFKSSPFSPLRYVGYYLNIRSRRRDQLVVYEDVAGDGKLYWCGWRPFWLRRMVDKTTNQQVVTCSFIRGTFNSDRLMIDAAECFNESLHTGKRVEGRRFEIVSYFGTANKPAVFENRTGRELAESADGSPVQANSGNWAEQAVRDSMRLLKWSREDIGPNLSMVSSALEQLALPKEADDAIVDIKQWLDDSNWFHERGIPHRENILAYGPPGNGKTRWISAVGEDFDLPIFAFYLASMYDDELHRYWQRMLRHTPCIAVLEDIDNVFHGRKNVSSSGKLSFDVLLNCLDGVERCDGLLLFLTTNEIDKLDPALIRPGRCDKTILFPPPSLAGRIKIAKKILKGYDYHAEKLAEATPEGTSGATFQSICEQEARRLFRAGVQPGSIEHGKIYTTTDFETHGRQLASTPLGRIIDDEFGYSGD